MVAPFIIRDLIRGTPTVTLVELELTHERSAELLRPIPPTLRPVHSHTPTTGHCPSVDWALDENFHSTRMRVRLVPLDEAGHELRVVSTGETIAPKNVPQHVLFEMRRIAVALGELPSDEVVSLRS